MCVCLQQANCLDSSYTLWFGQYLSSRCGARALCALCLQSHQSWWSCRYSLVTQHYVNITNLMSTAVQVGRCLMLWLAVAVDLRVCVVQLDCSLVSCSSNT